MKRLTFLSALALSVTAAPAALALGLGAGPLAAAGGFEWTVHGFYVIDFALLLGLLYWLGAKPAKAFLVSRHEAVQKEMAEATRLRAEAEARFQKYDALLASLEGEIAQIREQFRQDGEREKARILADAREATEKMRRDAEKRLQQEAAKVREELEHDFAARALQLAEQKVAQRMTPQVQRNLVKTYVQELERLEGLTAFGGRAPSTPGTTPAT